MQVLLFGLELYSVLICAVNGGPLNILVPILLMIIAGTFSFFQPMSVKAFNAVQSNGAQLALLGASTYHIMTEADPMTSFYTLFIVLSVDAFLSCMTFFATYRQQL